MTKIERKICNFNSIKVRLELVVSGQDADASTGFQFHKGTIRTIFSVNVLSLNTYISIP